LFQQIKENAKEYNFDWVPKMPKTRKAKNQKGVIPKRPFTQKAKLSKVSIHGANQ